jgi:DNA-binding MarR family transcriptional regulator
MIGSERRGRGKRRGVTKANPGGERIPGPPSAAAGGPISYAIFQLAKEHRATAGMLLRELDLYPGQELLLMQLWDRDHRTQAELVRVLALDASTVNRMVARLERQQFVRRQASTSDRRAVIVSLTPRGEALRDRVQQLWTDLEAITTKGLSQAERDDLLRALRRTLDILAQRDA